MKLTLEKVIGAIVVVVLGYMIYTHFLSRPTMVKIQKGKHPWDSGGCEDKLSVCMDEHNFPDGDASECFEQFHKCYGK